ncbi:MAG: type II toxin-antitoxin system VapC family toxin [Deltaproteobacteria bacterium]|nr:type II toxin-antitoxin system VapC family toxin [Deltaproteobacteria bacterium]
MSFLLDTNICIALLKGEDRKLIEKIKFHSPEDIFICSVVKAELIFGARKSELIEANLKILSQFFSQFESLPFDDRAAEFYGIIRAVLVKAGTPIGANDLLIASITQSHDFVLITRNRDEFLRIPGLRMENW